MEEGGLSQIRPTGDCWVRRRLGDCEEAYEAAFARTLESIKGTIELPKEWFRHPYFNSSLGIYMQFLGAYATVPSRNRCRIRRGIRIRRPSSIRPSRRGGLAQMTGTFGNDVVSTPCVEEMAFVASREESDADVVVFDTAPTGKTLGELAMPFDWPGFLQRQIEDGKELARMINMSEDAYAGLERDKQRYDRALQVPRDQNSTIFNLVLLPERRPVEETASAVDGPKRLGIEIQTLIISQCILPEVVAGNRFLAARSGLQQRYLTEIDSRFAGLIKTRLPLLDHDVSDLSALRELGRTLYGD